VKDIWLLFDKSQYGKKYHGQKITAKPMKAASQESADFMVLSKKAVITNQKAVAEKVEETPTTQTEPQTLN
jgi:hypothetical protein